MDEERRESRERRERRARRRRRLWIRRTAVLLTIALAAGIGIRYAMGRRGGGSDVTFSGDEEVLDVVDAFARDHGLERSDWPEDLLAHMETNPEVESFVLNYPLKKDEHPEIDLEELRGSDHVPLLMQWDERWGYDPYSGGMIGFTGCGPTCLSMVSIYLLDDPKYDPRYVAEFSTENGYSVRGNGSAWTLISEGGEKLGLDVKELPLDENRIRRELEAGDPIICIMGPGDFTTTGHYIVMTDYVDGKIRVNDPNSRSRSAMLWDYEQIQGQIRNLWACSR